MITRYRPDPDNPPQLKSDLARLDRMTDDDIDYSDIPELGDEFFARAKRATIIPNQETIEAMQAAERGEVTTAGQTGADLIAALQASPCRDIDIEPDRLKAKAMTDAPL